MQGFTIVAMLLISCHAQTDNLTDIQISTINPVHIEYSSVPKGSDSAMYEACQQWQLTKEQVKRFFQLAESYPEHPYSGYYQIPCKITGTLQEQGQIWQFTIQGGATGTWQKGNTIKYFGCNQAACEPLVIMPTDGMNPDD